MSVDSELLEAIATKGNVDIKKIFDQYSLKVSDYCLRDHRNGKEVEWFKCFPQRERAITNLYHSYVTKRNLYDRLENERQR